jgi:hypothetical protein
LPQIAYTPSQSAQEKPMTLKPIVTVTAVAMALFLSAGCSREEGPAEKAGKAIDEAVEDSKNAVENAGDKVEDAVDEAEKKMKEADK